MNEHEVEQFLKDNEYLTTFEKAQLADCHPKTIRLWSEKTGIKSSLPDRDASFFIPHKTKGKDIPEITDPNVWDHKEWFEEFYIKKEFGQRTISKIIGRPLTIVRRRLIKYGIPFRKSYAHKPHLCCNKEWLQEFYLDRHLSLRKCANIAGVNRYTICHWLVKFNIPIRDMHEATSGVHSHMYGKKQTKRIINKKKSSKWKRPVANISSPQKASNPAQ